MACRLTGVFGPSFASRLGLSEHETQSSLAILRTLHWLLALLVYVVLVEAARGQEETVVYYTRIATVLLAFKTGLRQLVPNV